VENLAQRLPGEKVRFEKITVETAIDLLRREEKLIGEVKRLRAAWRSRPPVQKGTFHTRVNAELHRVEWEKLSEKN
jgi:hypothetical protein